MPQSRRPQKKLGNIRISAEFKAHDVARTLLGEGNRPARNFKTEGDQGAAVAAR